MSGMQANGGGTECGDGAAGMCSVRGKAAGNGAGDADDAAGPSVVLDRQGAAMWLIAGLCLGVAFVGWCACALVARLDDADEQRYGERRS